MARRRTRYRIVYVRGNEAPKQVDLLVYTEEFARDYAQRAFSDAAIISVAPVARRKPIAAGQAAAWEVDQAVFDDVIRQLGIQWPVSIRRTSHRQQAGRCYMRRGVYKHYITVNKLETAALAGRHLWHELTHAAQHERHYVNGDWSGFLHWYKAQQNFPYRVRPCEIEAREAEEFNDIYPLTKPAERSKIAA